MHFKQFKLVNVCVAYAIKFTWDNAAALTGCRTQLLSTFVQWA